MGDEQKQLTDEQKKQLKAKVKSTQQYQEMMEYKNFFEGTDKYFNKLNNIQVNIMKENKKLLENLGGNLGPRFQIILNKHFSDNDPKGTRNMGDNEVDLTFYKNDEKDVDNISGLKNAVKELISKSTDKEVTRILKNLLTKITPIIDTMGKNLKNYKLNTRFKDYLLDEYTKLKNKALGNDKTGGKNKGDGKTENENENKPNKEVYAEKSTVEKGQEKLLRAGLFPVEAREKGLLPPEGETEKTKEKKPINREELQGIITQNALENSTDDIIKPAAKLADAMHLKPTEVTPKETTETKENETLGAPTISNETNTTQENNTPKIDDKQYEYELLRTDYINKIEAQLVPAIRAINTVLTQEQEQKEKKEAKEEEKKRKKEEKERLKYEQATPEEQEKMDKKKEKIEENKRKKEEEERQKYERATPEEKVKIRAEKWKKEETKAQKIIRKKLEKKLKNGETVTIEDLEEDKPKLEKNIATNTDICKFLLKLLRRDETSINTKAMTDVFMLHKMREYGKFDDEGKSDSYDQILLEMMFEDKSKRNFYDENNSSRLSTDYLKFARFLFRLHFVISNNIDDLNLLNNPDTGNRFEMNSEFQKNYKNIYDKNTDSLVYALEFLEDEIDSKLDDENSNENKKTKENNKSINEFYKIIKDRIDDLKNAKKFDIKSNIKDLSNKCSNINKTVANNVLKNLNHPIFINDNYFNIEKMKKLHF